MVGLYMRQGRTGAEGPSRFPTVSPCLRWLVGGLASCCSALISDYSKSSALVTPVRIMSPDQPFPWLPRRARLAPSEACKLVLWFDCEPRHGGFPELYASAVCNSVMYKIGADSGVCGLSDCMVRLAIFQCAQGAAACGGREVCESGSGGSGACLVGLYVRSSGFLTA